MHQAERVTIALDQDAHGKMSNIKGRCQSPGDGSMNDPDRLINWRKEKSDGTNKPVKGPLLKGDYQDHADEGAAAIRHVASATQPSPPAGSGAKTKKEKRASAMANGIADVAAAAQPTAPGSGAQAAAGDRFLAFRQPVRPAYGDRGQALRTQKHVLRRAPVTPESVLASIRQASGDPNAVGFYLSFDGGDAASLKFAHFTAAEAGQHMHLPMTAMRASPHGGAGTALGWGLSDAWDDVKSAADRAIDEAKKIAVEITDKVTVAIHYVDEVTTMVISSIADAMEIIGNFLEKIALLIVEFIEFLLFLLDWGAILATHKILRDTMFNALDYVLDGGKMADDVARVVGDLFTLIPGLDDAKDKLESAAAQMSMQDRASKAPDRSTDFSGCNGVAGTMVYSKIKEHSDGVEAADAAGGATGGGW